MGCWAPFSTAPLTGHQPGLPAGTGRTPSGVLSERQATRAEGAGTWWPPPSPCRVGVQRLTQPGPGVQTEGWGLRGDWACLPLSREHPAQRSAAGLAAAGAESELKGTQAPAQPTGGRRAGHDQRRRWRRARAGGDARARCGRVGAVTEAPPPGGSPHPIRRRAGRRAESLQRTPSPQPPGGRVSAVSALSLLSSPCPSSSRDS